MELLERDYKIDTEVCEADVRKNKFNDLTTSYYLISKRKERAGIFRQQYKDELKQIVGKKKKKTEIEEQRKQNGGDTVIDGPAATVMATVSPKNAQPVV